MYGQTGIGAVDAIGGTGNVEITVADAEWAAGIWTGAENARIDIYDPTLATKRNTLDIKIVSVDFAAKKLVTDSDLSSVRGFLFLG